jgi:AcrR family transcriptional regulator
VEITNREHLDTNHLVTAKTPAKDQLLSKGDGNSREVILEVALQLFIQKGYEGTSIDDIRKAAGFKSKASLYNHFKSKQEVADALTTRILGQIEHHKVNEGRRQEAGGRRQKAGFWRKLELPPKTFPLKRGGLYQVGFGQQPRVLPPIRQWHPSRSRGSAVNDSRGAVRNPVSLVGVKNRDVECGETGFLGLLGVDENLDGGSFGVGF